jgi:hypothetical protein
VLPAEAAPSVCSSRTGRSAGESALRHYCETGRAAAPSWWSRRPRVRRLRRRSGQSVALLLVSAVVLGEVLARVRRHDGLGGHRHLCLAGLGRVGHRLRVQPCELCDAFAEGVRLLALCGSLKATRPSSSRWALQVWLAGAGCARTYSIGARPPSASAAAGSARATSARSNVSQGTALRGLGPSLLDEKRAARPAPRPTASTDRSSAGSRATRPRAHRPPSIASSDREQPCEKGLK